MEYYKTQQMIAWDNETTKNYVLQEGITKGITKEKLRIAEKMLRKRTPIEFIEEVTGLTREEILRL